MTAAALGFLIGAWTCVLGLMGWCYYRLLRADPEHEKLPPPGTSL